MTVAVSVTCLQVALELITNIFNYSTGKKGQAMVVTSGNDLTQLLLGT